MTKPAIKEYIERLLAKFKGRALKELTLTKLVIWFAGGAGFVILRIEGIT
jgi:hypothetical protein